jgi:hypothetical protein
MRSPEINALGSHGARHHRGTRPVLRRSRRGSMKWTVKNMAQREPYQDLVLGSGVGSKLLSWHLARSGRCVAVLERRYIGGSCSNMNCLPCKNELWSAKVAVLLHYAARFGVVTGSVAVDIGAILAHPTVVEGLSALHSGVLPSAADGHHVPGGGS